MVKELKIPKENLVKECMEAMELFENHVEKKEFPNIQWRQWKNQLLKYLDNPTSNYWDHWGAGEGRKIVFSETNYRAILVI